MRSYFSYPKFRRSLRRILAVFITILLTSAVSSAQEGFDASAPKQLVILQSTKSYTQALATTRKAAKLLSRKMDLRGYGPHPTNGLTARKSVCEHAYYNYHCYVARGNGFIGLDRSISIEYSDAYEGFAKGYYIVVAAIDSPESPEIEKVLTAARKQFPDAYAKQTSVWLGCMH